MTEQVKPTFASPTREQVDHAMRDLDYAHRFVGYTMTPSAGNAVKDMYNLREAALFLTGMRWDEPLLTPGYKGTLNWFDAAKLVEWLRDVIGDADLAVAIEDQALGLEPYQVQNMKIAELLLERMAQYREVLAEAEEADEAVEPAGE